MEKELEKVSEITDINYDGDIEEALKDMIKEYKKLKDEFDSYKEQIVDYYKVIPRNEYEVYGVSRHDYE